MGQLKKIKGSTLLESLIASVLIVIIFMVSSLILNNIINSKIKRELGMTFRSLKETMEDSFQVLIDEGILKPK